MRIRDMLFPVNNGDPKAIKAAVSPTALAHTAHTFFSGFYQYVNTTGNQPGPGAEAFAFAQQILPLQDWKGPGELVQKSMQINSRQLYVTQSVIPTGLAGIAAGQVYAGNLQAQDLSG